ncbi:MAG: hypothetical protein AB1781_11435 [Pseudomonadota bacterium]
MTRPKPRPPRPDLLRQPAGSFGWLEDQLLHQDWLATLQPHGSAVLLLLALAADRHGASFFSRARMARCLAMRREDLDGALSRLLELGLVAHRPWRPGDPDGVWQLLPLPGKPHSAASQRSGTTLPIGAALRALGLTS